MKIKNIKLYLLLIVLLVFSSSFVCFASEKEFSDDELRVMAYNYFQRNNPVSYEEVGGKLLIQIREYEGGIVSIHILRDREYYYETMARYEVDRTTGIGVNEMECQVDLREGFFYRAMQMYTDILFANNTSTWEMSGNAIDENGYEMIRIGFYGIDTYSGLYDYLQKIFSPQIIQDLLCNYRNIEDRLYRINADRGSNMEILDWSCVGVRKENARREYEVKVLIDNNMDGIADSYKNLQFIQIYKDGQWIFSAFPYFY